MSDEVVLKDSERQKCEVWTRVMGYHRPVESFNIGKKGEFSDRKFFSEEKCGRIISPEDGDQLPAPPEEIIIK